METCVYGNMLYMETCAAQTWAWTLRKAVDEQTGAQSCRASFCSTSASSGALHGLLRVRAFTQDDAHIFCSEDQITSECLEVTNLILDKLVLKLISLIKLVIINTMLRLVLFIKTSSSQKRVKNVVSVGSVGKSEKSPQKIQQKSFQNAYTNYTNYTNYTKRL